MLPVGAPLVVVQSLWRVLSIERHGRHVGKNSRHGRNSGIASKYRLIHVIEHEDLAVAQLRQTWILLLRSVDTARPENGSVD